MGLNFQPHKFRWDFRSKLWDVNAGVISDDISSISLPTRLATIAALLRRYKRSVAKVSYTGLKNPLAREPVNSRGHVTIQLHIISELSHKGENPVP
jgi:hypothetical protein